MSQGAEWYNIRSQVQQAMLKPKTSLKYTEVLEEITKEFIENKIIQKRDPKTNQVAENFIDESETVHSKNVDFLFI